MSGDKSGVEELYKNFGILADAGDQASQVGRGRMRGERGSGRIYGTSDIVCVRVLASSVPLALAPSQNRVDKPMFLAYP